MHIEPLEPRVAPASVSLTYLDLDGDLVKITASNVAATAPPLDAADLAFVGGGSSGQLATLTLTDAGFDGAKIVFTVTQKAGGEGLAHVGFIDATGVDLAGVVVKGDLGKIIAGDSTTANDPALGLLQARTMGALGLYSQGGAGDLNSKITGKLGTLKIAADVVDAWIDVVASTAADGQIGAVKIGGSIIGGSLGNSGRVSASGTITLARIGGSVIGGDGAGTGQLFSSSSILDVRIAGDLIGSSAIYGGQVATFGTLGLVKIGGSLIGGAGQESGLIFSTGAVTSVEVGRDVVGGTGQSSGAIYPGSGLGSLKIGGSLIGRSGYGSAEVNTFAAIGDVKIGGSVVGGSGSESGFLNSFVSIGNVRIGGDLVGGSISGSASLDRSGAIISGGRIASLTIGGSLIAGGDASSGNLTSSGLVAAGYDLGPVKIGGSIVGDPTNPAAIIGRGQQTKPATGFDTAIASVRVGGDVANARILAGFFSGQTPGNADGAIGAVTIGGDWKASSLVAGAQDSGADGYGKNDSLQAGGLLPLVARIASITIGGDVRGSISTGDHFGFVAEQIDKLTIAGRAFPLTPGPSSPADNFAIPFTDDVRVLEV